MQCVDLSGGSAVLCYLSLTLPHQDKAGLVRSPETVRAAYRTQKQCGQQIFFDGIAGTRPVSLNTAAILALERLANHGS
jgi:hypothetical protein